jgi:hypothetical protein
MNVNEVPKTPNILFVMCVSSHYALVLTVLDRRRGITSHDLFKNVTTSELLRGIFFLWLLLYLTFMIEYVSFPDRPPLYASAGIWHTWWLLILSGNSCPLGIHCASERGDEE